MLLPLLAGAGVLWLLFGTKPTTATTQPSTPTEPQQPQSNADILRARVAELLRAADAAPLLVDPDAMDASAVELERVGLTAEAAQVRAKAVEVRAKQAPQGPIPPILVTPPPAADQPPLVGPIVTPPQAPPQAPPAVGPLPPEIATRAQAVFTTPNAAPIAAFVLLDEIERRFPLGSFPDTVNRLRAVARQLKAASPPATMSDAIALFQLASTNPERVSPNFLDAVAADVAADMGLAGRLRDKAADMRQKKQGMKIPVGVT